MSINYDDDKLKISGLTNQDYWVIVVIDSRVILSKYYGYGNANIDVTILPYNQLSLSTSFIDTDFTIKFTLREHNCLTSTSELYTFGFDDEIPYFQITPYSITLSGQGDTKIVNYYASSNLAPSDIIPSTTDFDVESSATTSSSGVIIVTSNNNDIYNGIPCLVECISGNVPIHFSDYFYVNQDVVEIESECTLTVIPQKIIIPVQQTDETKLVTVYVTACEDWDYTKIDDRAKVVSVDKQTGKVTLELSGWTATTTACTSVGSVNDELVCVEVVGDASSHSLYIVGVSGAYAFDTSNNSYIQCDALSGQVSNVNTIFESNTICSDSLQNNKTLYNKALTYQIDSTISGQPSDWTITSSRDGIVDIQQVQSSNPDRLWDLIVKPKSPQEGQFVELTLKNIKGDTATINIKVGECIELPEEDNYVFTFVSGTTMQECSDYNDGCSFEVKSYMIEDDKVERECAQKGYTILSNSISFFKYEIMSSEEADSKFIFGNYYDTDGTFVRQTVNVGEPPSEGFSGVYIVCKTPYIPSSVPTTTTALTDTITLQQLDSGKIIKYNITYTEREESSSYQYKITFQNEDASYIWSTINKTTNKNNDPVTLGELDKPTVLSRIEDDDKTYYYRYTSGTPESIDYLTEENDKHFYLTYTKQINQVRYYIKCVEKTTGKEISSDYDLGSDGSTINSDEVTFEEKIGNYEFLDEIEPDSITLSDGMVETGFTGYYEYVEPTLTYTIRYIDGDTDLPLDDDVTASTVNETITITDVKNSGNYKTFTNYTLDSKKSTSKLKLNTKNPQANIFKLVYTQSGQFEIHYVYENSSGEYELIPTTCAPSLKENPYIYENYKGGTKVTTTSSEFKNHFSPNLVGSNYDSTNYIITPDEVDPFDEDNNKFYAVFEPLTLDYFIQETAGSDTLPEPTKIVIQDGMPKCGGTVKSEDARNYLKNHNLLEIKSGSNTYTLDSISPSTITSTMSDGSRGFTATYKKEESTECMTYKLVSYPESSNVKIQIDYGYLGNTESIERWSHRTTTSIVNSPVNVTKTVSEYCGEANTAYLHITNCGDIVPVQVKVNYECFDGTTGSSTKTLTGTSTYEIGDPIGVFTGKSTRILKYIEFVIGTDDKPTYEIDAKTPDSIPSSGGSVSGKIISYKSEQGKNTVMAWKSSESCDWLTMTPTTGTGGTSLDTDYEMIEYTAEENTGSTRTCTVSFTMTDKTSETDSVTITQEGVGASYTYTIYHYETSTTTPVHSETTGTAKEGDVIVVANKKETISDYTYSSSNPTAITISSDESANTGICYYDHDEPEPPTPTDCSISIMNGSNPLALGLYDQVAILLQVFHNGEKVNTIDYNVTYPDNTINELSREIGQSTATTAPSAIHVVEVAKPFDVGSTKTIQFSCGGSSSATFGITYKETTIVTAAMSIACTTDRTPGWSVGCSIFFGGNHVTAPYMMYKYKDDNGESKTYYYRKVNGVYQETNIIPFINPVAYTMEAYAQYIPYLTYDGKELSTEGNNLSYITGLFVVMQPD